MKREIVRVSPAKTVDVRTLGIHGIIGVQTDSDRRYVAAQTGPMVYMLIEPDNANGLNRRDSIGHAGVRALAEFYMDKGESVYMFDTGEELVRWLIC
jgi:hypothetical protein